MSVQAKWSDLTAPEFANLPPDCIAILPLGATEQHGPHLPLSVDSDLVMAALDRSRAHWSADVSALILPVLTITKSNEHDAVPGGISLSGTTLLAMLDDIGAGVARAGIKRLFMLNGHGGNAAVLEIAARELRQKHGLITAHGSWFGFSDWSTIYPDAASVHDIHAGDSETSAMLALDPSRVDMTKAVNEQPTSRDWADINRWIGLSGQAARPGWVIGDLSESGICGDATAATAEKGAALLDSAGRGIAAFLSEFARFDPQ
ncbi:creatininase family protein [Shimia biformata]|uniref:creatininase family protein n=1 Tax=Shimia biformata TaxID=1294299 RepID=UPI00194E16C1|nr:creatininase family protein [Shimia biformata]